MISSSNSDSRSYGLIVSAAVFQVSLFKYRPLGTVLLGLGITLIMVGAVMNAI
jgi:hypothetical protein